MDGDNSPEGAEGHPVVAGGPPHQDAAEDHQEEISVQGAVTEEIVQPPASQEGAADNGTVKSPAPDDEPTEQGEEEYEPEKILRSPSADYDQDDRSRSPTSKAIDEDEYESCNDKDSVPQDSPRTTANNTLQEIEEEIEEFFDESLFL